ncbi:hypothetical protein [Sinisalibacter aestuarii]|uniref:Excalibur calcium-binding domain-containing protein n=1 Tax=Sinisalibacter aestuarii TaxID=2949426 RepID=A0ABQ5LQJ5_9RHOB|nr:hypothetical protein [Sinisalibacter aestuarii]GKY87284.1 hypothetical protein STA1M1_11530 [Sinisalibacter aestuarii]
MRFATFTTLSVLALAACSAEMPNSAPNAAAMGGASSLPPASAVTAQPLDGGTEGAAIAAETTAALGLAVPADGAPMSAMASDAATNAAAQPEVAVEEGAVASAEAISDEQNFAAVSARETIQSDADRIAENRAQYVVIEPTELPERPDGTGVSVVAYALATTNVPGQQLYDRSGFAAQSRFESACAKYGGDDRAQEVFLDSGGPQRDRYGMDPDGDGFACYWDPRPFRAAREGAPEEVTTYEVIETPGEG